MFIKVSFSSLETRFLESVVSVKTLISSNSIYCWDHKDTMCYVDTEETRSGQKEIEWRSKECLVGEEARSTEKGVIKFIRSTLWANINELKRMLSRPCHSSGRQNHSVDYEIMLLQKIKNRR